MGRSLEEWMAEEKMLVEGGRQEGSIASTNLFSSSIECELS